MECHKGFECCSFDIVNIPSTTVFTIWICFLFFIPKMKAVQKTEVLLKWYTRSNLECSPSQQQSHQDDMTFLLSY